MSADKLGGVLDRVFTELRRELIIRIRVEAVSLDN